jgi:hypothetical protein
MSRTRSKLLAAAVSIGIVAGLGVDPASSVAASAALPPLELTVEEGEGSWHADPVFRLDWAPDPRQAGAAPVYLVHDSAGKVVVSENVGEIGVHSIVPIEVPLRPGPYTAEVWLRSASGEGPRTSATLRFDNARPSPARPFRPDGWVPAAKPAAIEIAPAIGEQPISGISGYAVSVDRQPEGSPCAGPDRCSVAETDLRSGAGGGSISVGFLPEGINFAHVVAVSGSGMRSRTVETVALAVDGLRPEVTLQGAPGGWSNGPVRLTATATDSQSGMAPDGPGGPFTAIATDAGVPAVAAGGSVSAMVRGDGAHRVEFYARDAAGNVDDGQASSAPPSSAVVRIDEAPPQIAFAKSQDPAEPERIEATVTDSLSGPGSGRGSIAVRPSGTQRQFERIPTDGSAGKLTAVWDSDAFPPGSYEFKATGYDAAGNAGSGDRRVNGTRMVLSNPLKKSTTIEFGFGGRQLVWHRCARARGMVRCHREVIESFEQRPTVRMVPYGRGVPVGGRLTSASGSPLAGLAVRIVETFDSGAGAVDRTTTVQTGSDGTFLAHLAPGPNRRVEVDFAGNRVLTHAGGRRLRLGVRTSVRLRASVARATIGGTPVVFSGRIDHFETTIPSAGRPVELQFRVPGAAWSELRTVQTDAHGRFRYPYAFSDDDSRGVRFQFRAYAPPQPGWPYEPATSRPVAVTGR